MIIGLSHITLSVRELPRSFTFYVDLLGCRPIARWPKGAYLAAGDVWLALHVDKAVRRAPLPEYTHVAFHVTEQELADIGARIDQQGVVRFQDNKTEGASLYFLDPDGHKLEAHVGDLESRLRAAREKPWEELEFF
jgi:catechol 2,3-dioxygenase-like lactoylglutathione lyase family enzyme